MGELAVAIMRGAVAGKLRAAARGKDEQTASALMRAADRYSNGVREALSGISAADAGLDGGSVGRPAGDAHTLGRFTRPADWDHG
jgi:hypothetical protein